MSQRHVVTGFVDRLRKNEERLRTLESSKSTAIKQNDIRLSDTLVRADSPNNRLCLENLVTKEITCIGASTERELAQAVWTFPGDITSGNNGDTTFAYSVEQDTTARQIVVVQPCDQSFTGTLALCVQFCDGGPSVLMSLPGATPFITREINVPMLENNRIMVSIITAGTTAANNISVFVRFGTPTVGETTGNECLTLMTMRFDFTGSIQNFTVPTDVSSITIEAHGAQGGFAGIGAEIPGNGGKVVATFAVTAGAAYDVYVGEHPVRVGGWPDGGNGATSGSSGGGGGGRSEVRPTGDVISSALIVAGGGGGAGDGGSSGMFLNGGDAGFDGVNGQGLVPGNGATNTAVGPTSGGPTPSSPGNHPGGSDAATTSYFSFAGGGGGDGYYGGSGAGGLTGFSGYCGGGGGGSSHVSGGTSITYTTGENTGHGFVIISWVA